MKLNSVFFIEIKSSGNYPNAGDVNMISVWEAAENGDRIAVKAAVGNLANIDEHDDYGYSAFHYACDQGYVLIADFLLHRKADVNDLTEGKERLMHGDINNRKYTLHLAAGKGHLDIVKLLLKSGVDVNCPTDEKDTPLHYSSFNGHLAVAKYLIVHGGDVGSRNIYGHTPLHHSCYGGQLAIVQYLVSAGSDINSKDYNSITPLGAASSKPFHNLSIVKFLTENGCNMESTNEDGDTPVQMAREYILISQQIYY